jgi:hypothetical protein
MGDLYLYCRTRIYAMSAVWRVAIVGTPSGHYRSVQRGGLIMAGTRGQHLLTVYANPTYLALYEFEHEHVMGTPAWEQAANTAWTRKLRPHFKALIHLGKRIF